MFSRESYVTLIEDIRAADYRFAFFDSYEPQRCVLLRHDVDFSLADAAALAGMEADLGISATYFVLISSDFYNIASPQSRSSIERMVSSGARLGLHFDPTAYEDLDAGFGIEKATFERLTGVPLTIVSLHRPREFLTDNNRKLAGVRHTYEDEYFKDLVYVSDSGGSFRFGHPLETDAFREGSSIHLNLHPIWWTRAGSSPSEKLRDWEQDLFETLNEEVGRNCKTFDGSPPWQALD
jgi:hypothetical protein